MKTATSTIELHERHVDAVPRANPPFENPSRLERLPQMATLELHQAYSKMLASVAFVVAVCASPAHERGKHDQYVATRPKRLTE